MADLTVRYQKQQIYAPYVAEFVGTAAIATATAVVGCNSGHAGSPFGILAFGPLVVGFVYLAMTYSFAAVSGAHFNPAVSLMAMLHKRISPKLFLAYAFLQLVGGFVGVGVGNGMTGGQLFNAAGTTFVWGETFFVEVAFAALLCHVYLLAVDPEDAAKTGYHGMAVGFTFAGLSAAAASISGGVFNPAIGLPLQLINGDAGLWAVYFFAPLAGAVVAAFVGFFTASKLPSGQPAFAFGAAVLFEFFHTGAFVAVVSLVGRGYLSGNPAVATANLWAPVTIALFYAGQVYAGTFPSGGHLNPAVSFGVFLTQRRFHTASDDLEDVADSRLSRLLQLVAYLVVQIVGGIVGGLVAVRMYATDALADVSKFYPQVASGQTSFQVFVFEFFFVFTLVLCYLNTARAKSTRGNEFFGLACGLVLVAANICYAQAAVSFNPAVAIGLVLSADADGLAATGDQSWMFIVAPFLAAVAAVVVYMVTNEEEFVAAPANRSWNSVRGPLQEFVGNFVFLLCISATAGGANGSLTALAAGSMLAGIIFLGGHVSGGHYNPAVTLGIFLSRRGLVTWKSGLVYAFSQVLGSLLGVATGNYLTGATPGPAPGPIAGLDNGEWLAFLAEALFTGFLVYSVLVTGTSAAASGNSYFGLAIGFSVVAGAFAAGHLSGGSFNPAVSVGLIANNGTSAVADHLWYYLIAEVLGAALGAGMFTVTFEQEVLGAASRHFDGVRKFASEFWGTFYVFLITALVYAKVVVLPTSSANAVALGAFTVGAGYMVATFQARLVSGAHFNPAVTLATTVCTFTDPATLVSYAVAQILAAIAAGLVALSMSPAGTAFAPSVDVSDRTFKALSAEFIFTGIIVICALSTIHSRTRRDNSYFGITMGAAMIAGSAAAFGISQAAFNPATLGLVAVNGTVAVADDLYLYWVGPLLGALVGAVFYRISNGREFIDMASVVEDEDED